MTEQVANDARTRLSGSMDAVQTTVPLVDSSLFPGSAQFRVRCEDELMLVTAGAGTNTWTVTRGIEGTAAAPHAPQAEVVQVLTKAGLAQLIADATVPPDASTTVKGRTKLATAPVSAANPIAVGDNDPRVDYSADHTFSGTVTFANDPVFPGATLIRKNVVTTINYTLILSDAGKSLDFNNQTSARILTVPPNSSVNFPADTVIQVFQLGTGQVTVAPGTGVTFRAPGGLTKIAEQYGTIGLRQRQVDEWVLMGDLG